MNDAAEKKRLYVLDTNVLMHDPTALFRFEEHDVFLPMEVLEELDAAKKGMSEVARNVRQASRFIDELLTRAGAGRIDEGLPLYHPVAVQIGNGANPGRLRFQTGATSLSETAPRGPADTRILNTVLDLQARDPSTPVVLVSKDINLRIRAAALSIPAEDYHNDQALDDLSLLYSGVRELPADFWQRLSNSLDSWTDEGETFYSFEPDTDDQWLANQGVYIPAEQELEALVRETDGRRVTLQLCRDYRTEPNAIWGVRARNREQNFAMNLLMDPDIDFVTLLGTAGTGKTLLTLATGLFQTLDERAYREIIMTRATVPVGEDIGFLPGTEEEKMTPWMGALTDNLEFLTGNDDSSDWTRQAANDLLSRRIKIRSMNFMRGRTFLNRFVIIDEAQNLTPKQMKTLLTRAGPGTKIVCLGNIEQIDTPYLTETSSGLTYAIDRFKHWEHSGHVTLRRGERSRLADHASEVL